MAVAARSARPAGRATCRRELCPPRPPAVATEDRVDAMCLQPALPRDRERPARASPNDTVRQRRRRLDSPDDEPHTGTARAAAPPVHRARRRPASHLASARPRSPPGDRHAGATDRLLRPPSRPLQPDVTAADRESSPARACRLICSANGWLASTTSATCSTCSQSRKPSTPPKPPIRCTPAGRRGSLVAPASDEVTARSARPASASANS